VIVGIMFFAVFTPIGLLFRLIGRDPLHLRRDPSRETFWSAKPAPSNLRRYFQQF
jgi:hypothetical protein